MNNAMFTGICTALVTPFLEGQVNYPMLERLICRQIDAGIQAIVIAGTTGEAATLSDGEKLELFRRARAYAGNRCLIIAGTGANCTSHAVALSEAAAQTGADGLLVVSPYYNKATPQGLVAHYRAIASASGLPVILYNVPGRTGQDIPVSVYRQLAEIPNIIGIKEASPDITKLNRIFSQCADLLSVWTGNDTMICPAMSLGASGAISVVSNLLPEESQSLAMAALDGDFDTAASLQRSLEPLIQALFSEVNPIPVKAAMALLGYDCGPCRMPLTQLSPERERQLTKCLLGYR